MKYFFKSTFIQHRTQKSWLSFTLLFSLLFPLHYAQAAEVSSSQSGTVTLSATATSVAITSVVDSKSLLIFTMEGDSSTAGPFGTHVLGQLSCAAGNCTSIDFSRRSGSTGTAIINWHVLEFTASSNVTVQRGRQDHTSMSGTPASISVASGFTQNKSFVLLSDQVGGSVTSNDDFSRAEIDASGNVILSVMQERSDGEIAWQAVKYDEASVSSGNVNFALADSVKTAAVSITDLSKAWLIYNYRTTGTGTNTASNPIGQNLVRGVINSTSQLQFDRDIAGANGTVELFWFLVEFTDSTRVQQGNASLSTAEGAKTVSLSQSVDSSCAIPLAGYHQRGGKSNETGSDHTVVSWFRAYLNALGSSITLERGEVSNSTADVGWFVLELGDCGISAALDYGDAPVSGTAPDGSGTNNYGEASHTIVSGVFLGFSAPDNDATNQPTANADGDDTDGTDDEDILSIPTLTQGQTAAFAVFATGASGYLQGWIDFDGNGVFDTNEQIATNLQDDGTGDDAIADDGTIIFNMAVPANATTNPTYARFRWSTTQNLDSTTAASDGEVEDYILTINTASSPVDQCNASASGNLDTDGDNISNICDLDDDNDGILDIKECVGSSNYFSTIGSSGTNITNATYSTPLTDITYNPITVRGGTLRTYNAGLNGDAIRFDGAPVSGGTIMDLDITFSNPLHYLNFKLTDFDSGPIEFITVDAYDENGTLIDLTTQKVAAVGTYISQNSNMFISTLEQSANGNDPATDPTNSVLFLFSGKVSRLHIIFRQNETGSESIRMTELLSCQDSDGDGLPDAIDLDSDNDGIPDNIEAQTTQAYIKPNNVFDTDGVDTAYTGGLTPVNTDGSDEVDYLDADTDNDGIFDIDESGQGLSDANNDGKTDDAVGTNGLDNNVTAEAADNYSDINGLAHDGINFTLNDSDNDTAADGTDAAPMNKDLDYRDIDIVPPTPSPIDQCDALASGNTDTDGDNIANICDLDDDNDGIADVTEGCNNSPFAGGTAEAHTALAGAPTVSTPNALIIPNGTNRALIIEVGVESPVPPALTVTYGSTTLTALTTPAIRGLNSLHTYYLNDAQITAIVTAGTTGEIITATDANGTDNAIVISAMVLNNIDQASLSSVTAINETGTNCSANNYTFPNINALKGDYLFQFVTTGLGENNNDDQFTFNAACGIEIADVGDQNSNVGGTSLVIPSNGSYSCNTTIASPSTPNCRRPMSQSFILTPATNRNNTCDRDSDNDSVFDHLDIDADNDGIPDNIEAQTTQAYIAPSGSGTGITDTNNNGIDDVYGTGLTPVNTDGADTVDYLDTDSDNDSNFDIAESGLANNDTNSDGMSDSPVGINGLDNDATLESADNYADVNGLSHNGSVFALADTDSDVVANGSDAAPMGKDLDYRDNSDSSSLPIVDQCNALVSGNLDTDGDNVADICDLDDDNDGLSDITEGLCSTDSYAAGWYNNSPSGTFNQDGRCASIATNTHIYGGAHDTNIISTTSPYTLGSGLIDNTGGGSVRTLASANEANVVAAKADNDYLEYQFTTAAALASNMTLGGFAMADSDENGEYYFAIEISSDNFATSQRLVTDFHISPTHNRSSFFALDNVMPTTELIPSTSYTFRVYIYGASSSATNVIFDDLNLGFCQFRDSDNDGLPDYRDLDADNDGIPDNIEAQTTQAYIAPSGSGTGITDTNNNGIDDVYGTGLTPVNTDSSDVVDYLDTDSDNDSNFDIAESGLANNDSNNDGRTDSPVGINGLDNDATLESADNYSDVNGLGHNGSVFALVDTDSDVVANGSDAAPMGKDLDYRDNGSSSSLPILDQCNALVSGNLDTDGDNIADICDLDDDNDGLSDITEGLCSTDSYAAGWYNNSPSGTFNQDGRCASIATNTHIYGGAHDTNIISVTSPYTLGSGLIDNTGGGSVRTLASANEVNVVAAKADNDYLEYQFTTAAALASNMTLGGFAMADSDENGEYYFSIEISSDNFATSQRLVTDFHISPTHNRSAFFALDNVMPTTELIPSTSYTFRVYIYGASSSATNVIFDDLNLGFCQFRDSDNDGLPDYRDLDADNDGIPDNIEAQTTQAYIAPSGSGTGITDANNNGIDDVYGTGLTPVNTDSSDVVDYLDTDSDNDTIFDIAESGLANNDSNNDGRTDSPVGINGLDNDAMLEGADNYADVNGLSHDGSVFALADTDSDVVANGSDAAPMGKDLDYRDNQGVLSDYGDAPIIGSAPDGTSTNAYGEASHTIVSGTYLGAADPDVDNANQPTANADGDDADGTDDDDGISTFPTLTAGDTSYTLPIANITASGSGALHGWIDFDGNGTFDSNEHNSVTVTNGTPDNPLNWLFTDLMAAGTTFARFRFTSDASVTLSTPSSTASDGEVEDYAVIVSSNVVPVSCTYNNFTKLNPLEYSVTRPWPGDPSITYTITPSNFTGGEYVGGVRSTPDGKFSTITGPAVMRKENGTTPTRLNITFSQPIPANQLAYISLDFDDDIGDDNVGTLQVISGTATPADFTHDGPSQSMYETAGSYNPATGKVSMSGLITNTRDGGYLLLGNSNATVQQLEVTTGTYLTTSDWIYASFYYIGSQDYGDAPDSYATLAASTGANHQLPRLCDLELYLGATRPDFEADGQPNATATGDDADEDGITLPTLTQAQTATITATVSGTGGYLQGWIDFNGDGDFLDAGEQIATNLQDNVGLDTNATTGTIAFDVAVPASAVTTQTYARFRWSTTSGLDSTTAAGDGEVEDYALMVSSSGIGGSNFVCTSPSPSTFTYSSAGGAAPTAINGGNVSNLQAGDVYVYGSQFSDGTTNHDVRVEIIEVSGSGHMIFSGGGRIAVADHNSGDNKFLVADVSVVSIGSVTAGNLEGTPILLSDAGFGVYDIDGFGDMSDIGGFILPTLGSNNLSSTSVGSELTNGGLLSGGPSGAFDLYRLTNFGTNNASNLNPDFGVRRNYLTLTKERFFLGSTGAIDSSIPVNSRGAFLQLSSKICLDGDDTSDAPITFGDAKHTVVSGIQLGATIDVDSGSLAGANANGDGADDDGITLPTLTQDQTATITATASGAGGYLQGWIDFNGDGDFLDAGEQVATDLQDGGGLDTDAATGAIAFAVAVPASAVTTQTYARFRWSTTSNLDSTTTASDGEVEDYAITINSGQTPFACTDDFYFSNRNSNNHVVLQRINRDVIPYTNLPIGTPSTITYNAMGYNVQDNFIYAVAMNELIKIDKEGKVVNLGIIGGGYPNKQIYSGEFDRNGNYYVYDDGTNKLHTIDVTSRTQTSVITLSETITFWDMALDITGNHFYAMSVDATAPWANKGLIKVEIATGNVTHIGAATHSALGSIYLAFADIDGKVYLQDANNGVYAVDTTTGDLTLLSSSSPLGIYNDGTVCSNSKIVILPTSTVSGRVFIDTNVNGLNEPTETGVSGLPVVLFDTINNTCRSARTDATGNYRFSVVETSSYQLYEASRETIPVPQNCNIANAKDPAGYLSTTANVVPTFIVAANTDTVDQDFGDVRMPTFSPDHTGAILAGNVTFYTHQFTSPSVGNVDFTSNNTGNTTTGWSSALYQDANCNGTLDGAEANALIAANLATVAGQTICLINKVYAPANVANGESYSNVISADFNFNNNALAGTTTLKVTDLTKAAANDPEPEVGTSRLELRKTVQNITQGTAETEGQNQAKPSDVLKYRIYYSNTGTGVITDLIINDEVPDFTTINSAPVCEMPLPASLTSCTPSVKGSAVEWLFPASDSLQGGAKGVVSYEVMID